MKQLPSGKWSLANDELEALILSGTYMALSIQRVIDLHVNMDGYCGSCSHAIYQDGDMVGWYQAEYPCETIQALGEQDADI